MKLQPGDYFEEVKGQVKARISDPRGIVIDFEGSRMEFEAFMEKFKTIEKYMKERAKEWDEAMKDKNVPAIEVKP